MYCGLKKKACFEKEVKHENKDRAQARNLKEVVDLLRPVLVRHVRVSGFGILR